MPAVLDLAEPLASMTVLGCRHVLTKEQSDNLSEYMRAEIPEALIRAIADELCSSAEGKDAMIRELRESIGKSSGGLELLGTVLRASMDYQYADFFTSGEGIAQ